MRAYSQLKEGGYIDDDSGEKSSNSMIEMGDKVDKVKSD